ncbi:MAG: MFS transporter, partial [Albidovulum sp.]
FSHISVTAMGRWFVATRGRAVSIAGLGLSLGEVLLPLPVVLLIGWIGWRASWGMVAVALAFVIAPTLFLLLVRDRAPAGYSAGGGSTGLADRHWRRGEVWRHWLFPALVPLLLTHGFIGTVVFFHQAHVAAVKGWSLAAMAPGLSVYSVISVATALAAGWAVDRFGPHRLLPILTLPMGVGMLMIGPADHVATWIVALGFLGVTSGIANALWGALLPGVYGTNHLGSIRAVATAIMVLSTAIGPGITGILIDRGIAFPQQGLAMAIWCFALGGYGLWITRRLTSELN